MSYSDAINRINQFRTNPMSVTLANQKRSQAFQSILEKKMGERTEEITDQTYMDTSALNNSNNQKSAEIFVESTITGDVPTYVDQTGQTAYQMSGTGQNQCPQCVTEMNLQTGSGISQGVPTDTGLSENDLAKAAPYMQYVNEASQRYGMPVNLILGIMKAESNFNQYNVSHAGAKGLMQLMPVTAKEVGVTDVFDPRQNILGSVEYITKLVNRYNGDVRLALAGYNTGPGNIAKRGVKSSASAEYLSVPKSIRDYADRVLRYAGYQA